MMQVYYKENIFKLFLCLKPTLSSKENQASVLK